MKFYNLKLKLLKNIKKTKKSQKLNAKISMVIITIREMKKQELILTFLKAITLRNL